MNEISKPKRMAAAITRSRDNDGNAQGAWEENNPKYARLVAFQKRVGICRAEIASLTGENFKQDENGNWCVEVKKGKGGKSETKWHKGNGKYHWRNCTGYSQHNRS